MVSYREFAIDAIVQESISAKSFYLAPGDDGPQANPRLILCLQQWNTKWGQPWRRQECIAAVTLTGDTGNVCVLVCVYRVARDDCTTSLLLRMNRNE